jgi:hypothetical protein
LLLSVCGASVSESDRTNLNSLSVVNRAVRYSRSVHECPIGAAEISDARDTTLQENFSMRTEYGRIVQNDTVAGIATYLERLVLGEWKLAASSIDQPSANWHYWLPPELCETTLLDALKQHIVN